jgi:hypothetical protein
MDQTTDVITQEQEISISQQRSRSKPYRKRDGGRVSVRTKVKQIVRKSQETKFFDATYENKQLYHNIGFSDVAPGGDFDGTFPDFFNPWADILKGTGRQNRLVHIYTLDFSKVQKSPKYIY